jgi:hypothetical protein
LHFVGIAIQESQPVQQHVDEEVVGLGVHCSLQDRTRFLRPVQRHVRQRRVEVAKRGPGFEACALPRKTRVTHLKSLTSAARFSFPWVGRQAHAKLIGYRDRFLKLPVILVVHERKWWWVAFWTALATAAALMWPWDWVGW